MDIKEFLKKHQNKSMLRFITCGSVDDGKSTLIGRILYDSHAVLKDQMKSLEKDSKQHGTTGDAVDLALLVDGLHDERQQGITIDVAYRFFHTNKRKFIIADTPGHEQFTRNMATGSSTAELAVILIDARKGVLTQTKRHSFITTLMGIKKLIIAVNKMDLVDNSEAVFNNIVSDYNNFIEKIDEKLETQFIPISALNGDNVVYRSEHMNWYKGESLLDILENIPVENKYNKDHFRLAVQYVNRPNSEFRGFCGMINSGHIAVGEDIIISPSKKRTKVLELLDCNGAVEKANAPSMITLRCTDEIDISRGDVITKLDSSIAISNYFKANIVWMSENALKPNTNYIFKLRHKETNGFISKINYKTDINTLDKKDTDTINLNDIAFVDIELETEIPIDIYTENTGMGNFIIIDKLSNNTVACGMVSSIYKEKKPKSENITWHDSKVSQIHRSKLKNQNSLMLWFTGLSGAGKSTIANELEKMLYEKGFHTYLLDGDNVRYGLNRDLGFGKDDRSENIRRIAEAAKLMVDAGLIVISAFISPFRKDREMARSIYNKYEFLEVYIDTPIEECSKRDPKGLYKKALSGEIGSFTGISSPYEEPFNPDIIVKTTDRSVESCVNEIFDIIEERIKLG